MGQTSEGILQRPCVGIPPSLGVGGKQTEVIDKSEMEATNWQWICEAGQELYDLLVMVTSEEALTIVELAANHGFEAWRSLYRRMDPVGEDYEFEAAESLMMRERCKDVTDLLAAIENGKGTSTPTKNAQEKRCQNVGACPCCSG